MSDFTKPLITATQAAEYLGLKLSTIRKLTLPHLIPVVRPTGSRCVRYRLSALEALVRQRTQPMRDGAK
jgi:excisionase family DNA binding protein